jgi:hypothetical protein
VPVVTNDDRLKELAQQLIELQCTDPLVNYVHLIHIKSDDADYLERARLAYAGMQASDYPVNRKLHAAWRLMTVLEGRGLNEEVKEIERVWVDLMCQAVLDPTGSMPDQYYLFWAHREALEDDAYIERWAQVCQRIDVAEPANPWLVGAICGYYHVEAAWVARGRGFANTVTEEGWKGFREHLEAARKHLEAAWAVAPQFPDVAAQMIRVSMGLNDGRERFWFERAINSQFDHYPAYTNYLWAIRPRWHGSLDQMYSFGVECLRTDRFDTRVPSLFYKAMQDIQDETDSYNYWQRDGVYENFLAFYEGKKRQPGQEDQQAWWDSMKVAAAWTCRRMPEAAAMMDELGDTFIPRVFNKVNAVPSIAVSEAYARSEPTAQAVEQADQMWGKAHYREAARLIESASADLAPDHPAQTYLSYYATLAGRKHQHVKGIWVNLLGRTDLNGWGVYRGTWEADDQGRLIGTSDDRGMELKCWYTFGYEVEIEGTLTFLEAPQGQEANAGILFAYYWKSPHSYHNDVLLNYDQQSAVTMRHLYHERQDRPAKIEKTSRYNLQIWRQHVRLTVDDQVVIDNWIVPYKLPSSHRPFAIGGYYREKGARVRFDELKARPLTRRPAWAVDRPEPVEADPMSADDNGQEE